MNTYVDLSTDYQREAADINHHHHHFDQLISVQINLIPSIHFFVTLDPPLSARTAFPLQ